MIRILHVLGGLDRGGAETMVINLHRAIDKDKIQFDYIIHTTEHQAYYDEIIEMGGRIYVFPAFNGKNAFELIRHWETFFEEHTEYKILHSHVRSYASLYLPIAKKHGVKTIVHSHSTSNGKGVKALVKAAMQYPLRYQADYFFSCSMEAGEWLFGKKIAHSDKHFVIKNAIDTKKYAYSNITSNKYRHILGLEGKFVLGHVGRFHPAKNHMFLLDVFSKVCEKCPNAILLLVGDGELFEDIKSRVAQLKLEDRVLLLGSRDDVPQLMQAMDAFLFPSLWEGLPLTVVEAQAAGLPCYISDRITTDVVLSKLVEQLPIDSPERWAESLLKREHERFDTISNIKNAGYDVYEAADRLKIFYAGVCELYD